MGLRPIKQIKKILKGVKKEYDDKILKKTRRIKNINSNEE